MKAFDIKLSKCIQNILNKHKNKKIILTADWNIDFLKANINPTINQFFNNMISFGLLPTITIPTRITERSATLLDNLITNFSPDKIVTKAIYDDISDHLPILINITLKTFKINTVTQRSYIKPVFSKHNISKFQSKLSSEDWSELIGPNLNLSSNDAYNYFYQKFKYQFDKAFLPSNQSTTKTISQPWMTNSLIKSCRKKSRLLKICNKTKTTARNNYVSYKNILKQAIRQEEKIYYEKQFLLVANDIRKTWKLINILLNKSNPIKKTGFFKINNTLTANKQSIATAFNDYFTNIGPNLAKTIPINNQNSTNSLSYLHRDSMVLYPMDAYEIRNIICNMESKSSCGIDQIPISIIKSVADQISPALASIINNSFNSGSFPDALKFVKITPILTDGDKTIISNYRPVSLLSTFSKIF